MLLSVSDSAPTPLHSVCPILITPYTSDSRCSFLVVRHCGPAGLLFSTSSALSQHSRGMVPHPCTSPPHTMYTHTHTKHTHAHTHMHTHTCTRIHTHINTQTHTHAHTHAHTHSGCRISNLSFSFRVARPECVPQAKSHQTISELSKGQEKERAGTTT